MFCHDPFEFRQRCRDFLQTLFLLMFSYSEDHVEASLGINSASQKYFPEVVGPKACRLVHNISSEYVDLPQESDQVFLDVVENWSIIFLNEGLTIRVGRDFLLWGLSYFWRLSKALLHEEIHLLGFLLQHLREKVLIDPWVFLIDARTFLKICT